MITNIEQALQLIQEAIIPQGIKASLQGGDNYQAIWSRDSMIAGLAGLLCEDDNVRVGFVHSIQTLAEHQAENGILPSNVQFQSNHTKVSYGSKAGRVDATLWWLVGVQLAIREKILNPTTYEKNIVAALRVTDIWEYHNQHLIYTPLTGNWADEYVIRGYTLYDNCLRYWAYALAAEIYQLPAWIQKSKNIRAKLLETFKPNATNQLPNRYWPAAVDADGYNNTWDMAGNALALLLNLNTDSNAIIQSMQTIQREMPSGICPAFYPIIHEQDTNWSVLMKCYSFRFKNYPYHFHNGGAWPVWSGLMAYALRSTSTVDSLFENLDQDASTSFPEYVSTDDGVAGGVQSLCFTASGILFHALAGSNTHTKIVPHL
jgi:hypothetical protein